ncbi:DUF2190 domain-containing protein [Dietzia natronolimnaea]|uniref:DUF2190 domain-containing protein n=1 Tax=Dietzia natronolimnaea TaxID=161920 RepID=A0A2A2WUJ4_9ACTN|nr:capsid cement protein [Dietzia natronolimnaea]PAY24654.1 DUF2190 domain-containing protein [Dietzia natronolimnaea]
MTYNNPARDLYNDGSDITCRADAAVTGKTFAAVTGPRVDNLITIATAATGARAAGVIKYDAAADDLVGIARGSGRIITVTAGGAITAGDDVQVGTNGRAVTHTDGLVVGYAVDTATNGTDVPVSLI